MSTALEEQCRISREAKIHDSMDGGDEDDDDDDEGDEDGDEEEDEEDEGMREDSEERSFDQENKGASSPRVLKRFVIFIYSLPIFSIAI